MSIQCALSSPTAHSIEEDGWSNSIDETITFIESLFGTPEPKKKKTKHNQPDTPNPLKFKASPASNISPLATATKEKNVFPTQKNHLQFTDILDIIDGCEVKLKNLKRKAVTPLSDTEFTPKRVTYSPLEGGAKLNSTPKRMKEETPNPKKCMTVQPLININQLKTTNRRNGIRESPSSTTTRNHYQDTPLKTPRRVIKKKRLEVSKLFSEGSLTTIICRTPITGVKASNRPSRITKLKPFSFEKRNEDNIRKKQEKISKKLRDSTLATVYTTPITGLKASNRPNRTTKPKPFSFEKRDSDNIRRNEEKISKKVHTWHFQN